MREECDIDIDILRTFDIVDNIIRDEEGRARYHYVMIEYDQLRPHSALGYQPPAPEALLT